MVTHIATFFDTLLGVSTPRIVAVTFAVTLIYLILRALFGISTTLWNGGTRATKLVDIVYIITISATCIAEVLGGFEWYTLPWS